MNEDFTRLPVGLPVPKDDGGADHIVGVALPSVTLPTASGGMHSVDNLGDLVVMFVYPLMAVTSEQLPSGWNELPGARGCTVEALGFKDVWNELNDLGFTVVGISSQSVSEQQTLSERYRLPFPLLSDAAGALRDALGLPTFEIRGSRYLKRLTVAAVGGRVERVWYPVFPPDGHPRDVVDYLRAMVRVRRFPGDDGGPEVNCRGRER